MNPLDLDRFYSFHAKFYDLTRSFLLFGRKRAVRALDVQKSDRVLDFACGTALNLRLLRATGSTRIIGMDYSAAMLNRARKKFSEGMFLRTDIRSYQLKTPVDKAICTYALSIIDDWEDVVRNMKESLRPKGTVVILDFYPLCGFLSLFNPIFDWWLARHGASPRKPIERLLRSHFRDVQLRPTKFGYFALWLASGL